MTQKSQNKEKFARNVLITPNAEIEARVYGGRAKCLQRLIHLNMPMPTTLALSFSAVRDLAAGQPFDMSDVLPHFGDMPLLSVRPSSESADWGGPGAILNIGMNDAKFAALQKDIGIQAASQLYLRFIHAYAVHVARLDADLFDIPEQALHEDVLRSLKRFEDAADEPFPQEISRQLYDVLRSMANAWEGTTARLLREAKGAPANAGLGLVIQAMALGVGIDESGSGVLQCASSETGAPQVHGRYLSQSQGREALDARSSALYLTRDARGPSLEQRCPDIFEKLMIYSKLCRKKLREEMQIEFTIERGQLKILDAVRIPRSPRAAVRIAVDLAKSGTISKEQAILRIDPKALSELLHRQIAPKAKRDVIASGIAASPGAATGRVVFSAAEAQSCAARGIEVILVRRETAPEDVRGMQAAMAVLTERGGITSHAAVIGRGMGVPCVVGASDLSVNLRDKTFVAADGRIIEEGHIVTVDGTTGTVLRGNVALIESGLDASVKTLLDWADNVRDIDIRANADTPLDAKTACHFKADGIGLCRSEHMFFEGDRLTVMREMIFSESAEGRRAALERLLPVQRADFIELFRIMQGRPVCIRLLDPPLHEFLPTDRTGLLHLAEALGLALGDVTERVAQLVEHNPMLGMRGVRLGIIFPEIYDMQARAIFEAALESGLKIEPEIMLPLVSAKREVELIKPRIEAIAASIRVERGVALTYSLGVMVETPRAALRAEDIAINADFLSFGTNDLTQMTYGLSRDDAGRFMSSYVQQGVYDEDPFHRIDSEGVGELLDLGARRGRKAKPDLILSICGEHGGSPDSIALFRSYGFNYVSCSPFRVPVARLAAAQSVLHDKIDVSAQ